VAGATLLGAVIEAATGVPGVARAAGGLTQAGAAGLIASYSRDQELQADQLGAEYLARTNFNPANMVDVIQVLSDQERYAAAAAKAAGRATSSAPGWLASHPSNDQRLQQIRATATKLLERRPSGWADDGRDRYQRSIAGMTFGDGREQGVVRGRNFFHEPLDIAITAPLGFRIVNDSSSLALINGARDAGLVLRPVPSALVQKTGSSHEAVLRDGLGATDGKTEKLTLGGSLPATHFVGQRRDAKGNTGSLDATIASGPRGQLFLLGRVASDAAALERARATLREAELSFRPLSAAERVVARPWQIKLVPMPTGGFAQLARSSPLTELAEQQLRLLNGVYGGHALPPAGQLVKVVE
jgi:predicted Zn-dependent protease